MIPTQYQISKMEFRLIFSRASGKMYLFIAIAMALIVPLLMIEVNQNIDSEFFRKQVGDSAAMVVIRTIALYNYLVAPILIPIMASVSFGGEIENKQMREVLCLPISRWQLITGKTMAFYSLILISLGVLFVVALGVGLYNMENLGSILKMLTVYFLSSLYHLALVGITFLIGTKLHSPSAASLLTMTALGFFFALHAMMNLPAVFFASKSQTLPLIAEFLPWEGLFAWNNWNTGWTKEPTILALYLLIIFGWLKFSARKMEI